MKKILCILCFVFCASASFAASEKFYDCGRGYYEASARSTHGIQTSECRKVWCMDLENGKYMGSGNDKNAHDGYEYTSKDSLCDNNNHCIDCFGKRKWCNEPGTWSEEFGVYIRSGSTDHTWRSVYDGKDKCYKWQEASHKCDDKSERALWQSDGSYTCLSKDKLGSNGRSAIKSRALRRTAGPAPAIRKR